MSSAESKSGESVLRRAPRSGFTLIELLVTVTIIAILAGIVLGALNAARHTARQARSKSTITKLDDVIMRRYEAYATRRIPISTSGLTPETAARNRLDAVRVLMRLEMPERWAEVNFDPSTATVPTPLENWPALHHRYYQYYTSVTPDASNELAECLYMIVAIGGASDMEVFNESEIGDLDDDGAAEFLDGWGRPIQHLRWAPGFTPDSEIQTDDVDLDNELVALDPFDPLRLDVAATGNPREGYQLYPLIFSRGRDGVIGLQLPTRSDFKDPWATLTMGEADGTTGDHHDNVHNHRIEAR